MINWRRNDKMCRIIANFVCLYENRVERIEQNYCYLQNLFLFHQKKSFFICIYVCSIFSFIFIVVVIINLIQYVCIANVYYVYCICIRNDFKRARGKRRKKNKIESQKIKLWTQAIKCVADCDRVPYFYNFAWFFYIHFNHILYTLCYCE